MKLKREKCIETISHNKIKTKQHKLIVDSVSSSSSSSFFYFFLLFWAADIFDYIFSRNANLAVVRRQKRDRERERARLKTKENNNDVYNCVVWLVVPFALRCVPSWTSIECAVSKVNRMARVMPSHLYETCASCCLLSKAYIYWTLSYPNSSLLAVTVVCRASELTLRLK